MSEQSQWQAVVRRDAGADGRFVFAVRTTGIYCRPSCPARRPRRANVEFYPVPEAAEAAGFRACKRCAPRSVPVEDPAVRLVRDVWRTLERANGSADLQSAAVAVGRSPGHVRRVFKRVLGMTPRQVVDALRQHRLRNELRSGRSVATAQYDAGFSSSSRLYERTGSILGMTPARYRDGGVGVTVRFGFGRATMGQVLVATTDRGVCAVKIGDRREALEADLRAEFPRADIKREDAAVDLALTRILEAIDEGGPTPTLPLDVQATAFQARVWRALTEIPRGQTRTYAEVARAIGAPRAVRAVAGACAANPVAVVIPCHRVVRADGGLGGYRWGEGRKRRLLEREGEQTASV